MWSISRVQLQGAARATLQMQRMHVINQLRYRNTLSNRRAAKRTHSFVRIGIGTLLSSFVIYDGVVNEFTYCGATMRFVRSLKTAALIAFDYILVQRHETDADYEMQLKAVHQKSANRLVETCMLNGGLYIKVGQGVAAINHILPKEYTNTLEQLQDKCLPTTREDVQRVFREDFGQEPEQMYTEFDYKPVAAASLAQVFKAKLKSGELVAVKVQYSDLQKRFTSDLGTIMFLQDIVELFFKNYNFGWILRDLRKNLVQELNFVHEGENAERCAKDLAKFKYVHVPNIYWNLTKPRVLTMEWVDGFKVSDMNGIAQEKLNLRDVDVLLFKMFADQIFNTGFVHADPHPGNVFVRKNAKTGKAELVLLDHGLYEYLPEQVRLPLCKFWEATVLRDELQMENAAKSIGINDYMKFAEVLFQQPIRIHGGRIRTKLTDTDIAYIQQVAKQNFDIIMNTLKEMPRNMLFVIRNLNTIRAIGRQHGDVVDRPRIMARYAQRCLYLHYRTFSGYISWIYRRAVFEYCLWLMSFKLYCLNLYFNILYKLNRAPAAARTLMSDLRNPESS